MGQRQSVRARVSDTPISDESNDIRCDLDTPCNAPLVCDLERERCVQRPQDTDGILEIIWEGFPVVGRAEVIEAVVKDKFIGWSDTTCDFGQDIMEGENYGNLLLSEVEELTGRKVISFIDTETAQILCENREDLLTYWLHNYKKASLFRNNNIVRQGNSYVEKIVYSFSIFWKDHYIDREGVDKVRNSNLSLFLLAPTQYQVHPYNIRGRYRLYHVIPVGEERPEPVSRREELTDAQLLTQILERGREVRQRQLEYLEERRRTVAVASQPLSIEREIEQATIDNVQNLNLRSRQLTTLPEELFARDLLELNLSFNHLTEIPEAIGNLTTLQVLDLNRNYIVRLPESIGNLTSLKELDLSFNKLVSLPESIGNLTSLQELYLQYNELIRLPESIENLTSLQELNLADNQLATRLVLPSSLLKLNLSNNHLREVPINFEDFPNLIDLQLGFTELTNLPESIRSLVSLKELNVRDNYLYTLPDVFDDSMALEDINLWNNQLGRLPPSLLELQQLSMVYLDGNPIYDFDVISRLRDRGVHVYFEEPRARRNYDEEEEDYYS